MVALSTNTLLTGCHRVSSKENDKADMDGQKLTAIDARRVAREVTARIFEENMFGASDPAPRGTLRGIDVLPTSRVTQKLSRALQTILTSRGALPDLLRPQTFFEKLTMAKFFAPVPMPSPADKLAVGQYVPAELHDTISVIPPVWSGRTQITKDLLDQLSLPKGVYYAKSNSGSGTNDMFEIPPTDQNLERLARFSENWLTQKHGERAGEWWYDLIRPQNMIEPDLAVNPGESLSDWKFHTGGGNVLALQLDLDRGAAHRQLMFERDFTFIPEKMFFQTGEPVEKPARYDEIVEIVEAIAKPFEFARVDLYLVGDKIYLGEITLAPIGGQRLPISEKLDHLMGARWKSDFFD
ncbi:ATP-grasp fold amidoligase family protein [Shimia sp.]|uniref:ATP-grasp fold amidoligase family protein n=1 Tax=Shimia sp. TaxID=1954381 RepID=UPI00329A0BD0